MNDEQKRREYQKDYREKNREKVAHIKRLWRKRFPEKQAEYDRRSRLRKKGIDPDTWIPPEERKRAYVRREVDWSDKEQRKAYFQERYRTHGDEMKRAQMEYYQRNRERIKHYNSAKYFDNKEEILKRQKEYREKNRELVRARARESYRRRREELGKPYKPKINDKQ